VLAFAHGRGDLIVTAYWIVAGITVVLATTALVRVAMSQRAVATARGVFADFERRVNEQATQATIASTRLGKGRKVAHTHELESSGFELVLDDGTRVTVAEGARVDYIGRSARLDGTEVTIPEGTRVRFLPPDKTPVEGGPHKSPAAFAYTRGDALILFEPGARLLLLPTRVRRTSVPRMVLAAGVTAALVVLCGVYGPDTRWNALLFLEVVALFIDQVLAKGILSWALCTREPRPDEL
jgi:hypothetical protein